MDQEFKLEGDFVTIGREDDNDILISHPSVSSNHAQFKAEAGDFRLVDLNSTNGSRVNDEKVNESMLRNGDVVMLGNIIFSYQSDNIIDAPPLPEVDNKVNIQQGSSGQPTIFKNLAPFKKPDSTKSKAMTLPVVIAILLALGGMGYLGYVLFVA
jgi:pSer/pThr/pTyr-binding forkhead associated (FHA) protein